MERETNVEKLMKNNFIEKLINLEKKENHYNVMTKLVYDKIIEEVEEAKTAATKTPKQYRRLKRFNVLQISDVKKLVTTGDLAKYYLTVEEIFDVIQRVHMALGHGGRDKMKRECTRKYANITTEMINIFLAMCEICQLKKNKRKESLIREPILHTELKSRCQVNFIDMQSQADRQFNFIMVYQDHLTKFVLLRALESRSGKEVADQLDDIFSIFGAPCILHIDNDREFVNCVITELSNFWPELKLDCNQHSHSQWSVEQANQDIVNMLSAWMKENEITFWANSLRYVQFMKNTAYHSGIMQTPYKAMFGIEPRVGLTTSSLTLKIKHEFEEEREMHDLHEVKVEVDEQEKESFILNKGGRRVAHDNLENEAKKNKLI